MNKEKKFNIQFASDGYGRAYSLLEKYEKARDIFNKKYKDIYQIRLFQDLQCLNIYFDILQDHKFYTYQILNKFVKDLSVEEIFKAYEELI